MKGSFSEESLAQFAELVAATLPVDFAEGNTYDFTTCIRPDGSAYGTGGKCRKGTEGQAKEKGAASKSSSGVPVLTKEDMKGMSVSELKDVKKQMDEQAFGKDSGPVSNTKLQMLSDQNKAINEELKSRVTAKGREVAINALKEAPIAPVPPKPIKDPIPGVLAKAKELKDLQRREDQRVTDLAKAGKIKGVDPGAVDRILAKKAAGKT